MVKDFYWKKGAGGWKDTWCPLGEHMVSRASFDHIKTTSYRGPVSQHLEYDPGDARQMTARLQRDLEVLKE
jgi:hypothetical protein